MKNGVQNTRLSGASFCSAAANYTDRDMINADRLVDDFHCRVNQSLYNDLISVADYLIEKKQIKNMESRFIVKQVLDEIDDKANDKDGSKLSDRGYLIQCIANLCLRLA